jgi:hypothetical protein
MFFFSNAFLAFQKIIGTILVSVLSLGYSAGLSVDFQGVYYKPSSIVTYCFYDSTKKVGVNEFIQKNKTYNIHLARNESEACQIVVRSKFNSNYNQYTVEFTDFTNENGDKLDSTIYQEHYISCFSDKDYGTYPDALVPYTGGKQFSLKCQMNWPFYISVHADKDTPAGTYTAHVIAKSYDGGEKVQFIADVTATVWNFTLPETPSCDTAFGLSKGCIANAYYVDVNSERANELYKQYYNFLLDHKISAYDLPVDILSDEADAYMSDPRIKSFRIPYSSDDATLQRYYNKVNSNPVWAAKGFFYPIDEPGDLAAYQKYTEMTDRLNRLCPGYNMVTPANCASFKGNGNTYYTAEMQAGRSNILCGISNIFGSDDFLKQVDKRRADGSKIWWYVCCGPKDDYCNIFIHWAGIRGRLLLWQQKELNITGLLYWDTTYWTDVVTPWSSALTTPWTGNDTFGDGSLMYNGQNGPISSLRLEEISDGIDDYEYLTIAQKLFGDDYMNKKISKVSKDLTHYTLDDSRLASVREQIGNDIEAALNK